MSKRCPLCESKDFHIHGCGYVHVPEKFSEQSVFDRITASPEVLAPKFIYTVCTSDGEQRWCSALLEVGSWFSEAEAIAATVARMDDRFKFRLVVNHRIRDIKKIMSEGKDE